MTIQREKQSEEGSRERWIKLVAQGRGRQRDRIKVEVPVYGNIKFAQCELDALSLPPKHTDFEPIKKNPLKHRERIAQTKTRWGWRELVYDNEGKIIEKV